MVELTIYAFIFCRYCQVAHQMVAPMVYVKVPLSPGVWLIVHTPLGAQTHAHTASLTYSLPAPFSFSLSLTYRHTHTSLSSHMLSSGWWRNHHDIPHPPVIMPVSLSVITVIVSCGCYKVWQTGWLRTTVIYHLIVLEAGRPKGAGRTCFLQNCWGRPLASVFTWHLHIVFPSTCCLSVSQFPLFIRTPAIRWGLTLRIAF